jgi:hypothetical protein
MDHAARYNPSHYLNFAEFAFKGARRRGVRTGPQQIPARSRDLADRQAAMLRSDVEPRFAVLAVSTQWEGL